MEVNLKHWFKEHDDIGSTSEVAVLLDIPEGDAREFGRRAGLRRIGSSFAFKLEDAEALAAEVEESEDGDGDEEEEEETEESDDE